MTPTFSIIIPVYNVAPYLRECLDSVLAAARTMREKCEVRSEKCGSVEIICVDDGSTDGSGAILDEYAERSEKCEVRSEKLNGENSTIAHYSLPSSQFRVIHQTNAGPGAARNAGLDVAQGDWISFIDADDTVELDYLTGFMSVKEKADVNFFSVRFVYNDGSRSVVSAESDGVISDQAEMLRLLSLMAWNRAGCHYLGFSVNKFYRASIIRDHHVRFVDELRICEDEVFLFRCLECVKTIRVDSRAPYNYKWRDTGLTCAKSPPYLDAAKAYREIALRTKHPFLYELSERRVAECCDWRMYRSIDFAASCRIVDLMKDHFRHGRNRSALVISRIMELSMPLAKIFFHVCILMGKHPAANVDWQTMRQNRLVSINI